jgi:hypothetical protein
MGAHARTRSGVGLQRAGQQLGAAAGFGCPWAVSTYLMGVALTTGGLIILALMLFVIVRKSRAHVWSTRSFTVAGQPHHTIETVSQ